jgi:hypothetical protein
MKTVSSTSRILAAGAALLLLPVLAGAQEPVKSFDQLNTRLKAGDTIYVTDAQGHEVKGKIRDLSAISLLLDAGGTPQDFQAARVAAIQLQPKDSLRNGVLWGALAGFVGGALSCLLNPQCGGDDEIAAAVSLGLAGVGAAAGAGIGAGVDAAIKGPRLVIYRGAGTQSAARFSLAPLITPRHKGVAVAFTF